MKTKLLLIVTLALFIFALLWPATQPAHAQDVASDLLGRINGLRSSLGIPGYAYNSILSVAAQNQASWMAATGQISHTQSDGSTPTTRAAAAGYPSGFVSENIYMGTMATAESAWIWWLNSPIHYRGITSSNYTEVGIASASGANGTAFVLVFGNPNGWQAAPPSVNSSGSDSSSAAAAAPSFIVGVDNNGNIMHEIQPDQTLGDIALLYGYTWEDIPNILLLNNMTDADIRDLEIGGILLVPPWDGTYTPTPGDVVPTGETPEATTEASVAQAPAFIAITVLPSPTPITPVPSTIAQMGTSAVVPEWVVMTSQAQMALTLTPTATTAAVSQSGTPAWTAATVTPAAVAMVGDQPGIPPADQAIIEPATAQVIVREHTSPLLYVAVALQVGLLMVAGAEFWRRSRK